MSLFSAITIAGSGVAAFRKALDATSDNIANMNNAVASNQEAFEARYVLVQAADYESGEAGVRVVEVQRSGNGGKLVYEPDHPLADGDGYVRYPAIDLGEQMGQLMVAQRGYQANLAVIDRARNAYEAALQLGRGA